MIVAVIEDTTLAEDKRKQQQSDDERKFRRSQDMTQGPQHVVRDSVRWRRLEESRQFDALQVVTGKGFSSVWREGDGERERRGERVREREWRTVKRWRC